MLEEPQTTRMQSLQILTAQRFGSAHIAGDKDAAKRHANRLKSDSISCGFLAEVTGKTKGGIQKYPDPTLSGFG